MTAHPPKLRVMLVAAEASGDVLGAGLARALRARLGDAVDFIGVGGPEMAREGVESPFDIVELSILGIFEALQAYPRVRRRLRETVELARKGRPDVVVLIDSWGFTTRLASRLRRLDPNLRLVKYVAPQVWASRPGRVRTLAGWADLLLSIHRFELDWFEPTGLKTVFVGNPALTRDFGVAQPDRVRAHIGASPEAPILLLLPGSRPSEIARMAPVFRDAVERLAAERPQLQFVAPLASTVAGLVRREVEGWPVRPWLIEDETLKVDAFAAGTAALACSGTVSTELALAGCPMVVTYRLGPLTYQVVKRLLRTPYVTLFNIAAGRMVAPELLQDAATGANLAHEIGRLLDDPELRARRIAAQYAALQAMGRGEGDPSGAAAAALIAFLAGRGRLALPVEG